MTNDFADVAAAAARSLIGRATLSAGKTLAAAGSQSWLHQRLTVLRSSFGSATEAARLRWCATVIAVAAAGHLALRLIMPPTVVPAMPAMLYAGVAVVAALVALQAPGFTRAWQYRRGRNR